MTLDAELAKLKPEDLQRTCDDVFRRLGSGATATESTQLQFQRYPILASLLEHVKDMTSYHKDAETGDAMTAGASLALWILAEHATNIELDDLLPDSGIQSDA